MFHLHNPCETALLQSLRMQFFCLARSGQGRGKHWKTYPPNFSCSSTVSALTALHRKRLLLLLFLVPLMRGGITFRVVRRALLDVGSAQRRVTNPTASYLDDGLTPPEPPRHDVPGTELSAQPPFQQCTWNRDAGPPATSSQSETTTNHVHKALRMLTMICRTKQGSKLGIGTNRLQRCPRGTASKPVAHPPGKRRTNGIGVRHFLCRTCSPLPKPARDRF